MNEIERAIESCNARIKYLYKQFSLSNSIDHQAKLARQIDDEKSKLSALKKQKQTKGCECCKSIKAIFSQDKEFDMEIEKNELSIWENNKCIAIFEINNCPICGRELT